MARTRILLPFIKNPIMSQENAGKIAFTFPLPNRKIQIYQAFAYGILLLNLLMLSMVLAKGGSYLMQAGIQLGVWLILLLLDIRNHKKGKQLFPIGILMLAYGVFWIRYGVNWAFAANVLLWFLYTISKRKLIIYFHEHLVEYPSFPKKSIPWSDLNNVMLKDDILTIDCKNNKIYQHNIQDSEQFADEIEFNEFCGKHLTK